MVDATTGHEAMSFMDGSSGYNQIRMSPKDEECTAFRTPKGIYCYKVMPFGLKNAGATYQRVMQNIFDNMLHTRVECYVDDLVVKTKNRRYHLEDLRIVFERLRKFDLKMNPLKCAFGVTSGKFLGFIVRHRGIEVDPAKIDAIQKMPRPKNLRELQNLQGNLAFIRRFISNLAGRCQPFNHLLRKDIPFHWDQLCQNAFESIKTYLLNPPVLGAPMLGKLLILYIAAQERSLGALLAQENEEGKEQALYYLSRTLIGVELNYTPVEKICLGLLYAIKKLRHYFEAYTIKLISRADPVKFVMTRPVLSGRLARWSILFNQYEITYTPQKAVKGQALANFLADHPLPAEWELSDEFLDEDVLFIEELPPWTLLFDGSARRNCAGADVVLISPERQVLPFSFVLGETCSNNAAEYQALIVGLKMALEMKILMLEIYGDSKLIINQLLGNYEVKKEDLLPYHEYASGLLEKFDRVFLNHVPREENRKADALANLATTMVLGENESTKVYVCHRWVIPRLLDLQVNESHHTSVRVIEEEDWRQPLIEYLEHGKLPEDPRQRTDIKRRAPRFIFYKETLFRRSFEGLFLRYLDKEEARQAMEEAHSGSCGAHQSGPKLHFRIKRMGYYWATMVKDCMDYAKRCQACQFHANYIHQPPEPFHPTVASWPFDAWGLDVVGPLPKSSMGHMYILAATDYFSKWAEAVPLKEVKKETVVDFIKSYIIFRYGIPRYIITDNGTPFDNKLKVVAKNKRDWHERIGEALWAYRTTFRTATQATPYSLVYGVEAVLPLEQQIPSLRIAIQEGLTSEENAQLRLAELEEMDEKRLEAQQKLECYQARLARAFNKKIYECTFKRRKRITIWSLLARDMNFSTIARKAEKQFREQMGQVQKTARDLDAPNLRYARSNNSMQCCEAEMTDLCIAFKSSFRLVLMEFGPKFWICHCSASFDSAEPSGLQFGHS
ncbi:PREDICTED: uncharacterized protein LOC109220284 [Nicotiana attenuata]|uniref:uncharacterized protein LOC109220284 n=1 Tax=Nicotiana attenuata TaxID=49451 RepID=UPI000904A968|nr:PREDICTED: uncharacterized protein LOC109220284 [Nicotiana attenuata]